MKKITSISIIILFAVSSLISKDIIGYGYGSTRGEARANAVSDIKSQIIVEQESTVTIETMENGDTSYDAFSFLITEYSRELPLLNIIYEDTEDNTAEYGMNWHSTAVIPESSLPVYTEQISNMYSEIVEVNNLITDNNTGEKNLSWQKSLLDLCYDYSNYELIISLLSPGTHVKDLPVSINRVRLEYEDMLNREKNSLELDISSLTLMLADGDGNERWELLLEDYQKRYLDTVSSIERFYGEERESVSYSSMEFSMTNPVTASDYMLRIESNRRAFAYYRNSPVNFDDRLEPLAEATIEDIDMLARTEFEAASGSSDLSLDILSYNDQMEGWIARGSMMLGETTVEFSFLIPYENLVGSKYDEIVFERWNSELMSNPESIVRFSIKYTVHGGYIGNTYVFSVNAIRIERIINDITGETRVIREMEDIPNPVTITFEYGTYVDLGDINNELIRKKANTEVQGVTHMKFYVNANLNADIALPFTDDFLHAVSMESGYGRFSLNSSFSLSAEFGLRFENDKEGREKRYYGVGLRGSLALYDILTFGVSASAWHDEDGSHYRKTIIGPSTSSGPSAYEIGLTGFYMYPTDGTLRNFLNFYGGLGADISETDAGGYLDAGIGFHSSPSLHFGWHVGIGLRFKYNGTFSLGIRPDASIRYTF